MVKQRQSDNAGDSSNEGGQGDAKGKVAGLRRPRPCPICSKPSTKENYPFCSQRCKDVDLSRWLTGAYAIPAAEEDDPDESDLDINE